ncbi:Guanine nucleotide-binding-like protein 1 [Thoreauomyces humboldtii]|nr:Guanine nucleotide-binding-like protein 1 [Thoreauomyces humboldtii]
MGGGAAPRSAPTKRPFSLKAKKLAMQKKRVKNAEKDHTWGWDDEDNHVDHKKFVPGLRDGGEGGKTVLFTQDGEGPSSVVAGKTDENISDAAYGKGELESVFAKLSPDVVEARKKESQLPLERLPPVAMEVSFPQLHSQQIPIPKRPAWSFSESREHLQEREEKYFEEWKASVYAKHRADELSYFEHNLEVWRQLWRVVEISDIVLFIVDVRHPVLHFPPSLYDWVVKELGRKMVLVFNKVRDPHPHHAFPIETLTAYLSFKIDLVTPETLEAWTQYFKSQFPELVIASFSCYSKDEFLTTDEVQVVKNGARKSHKSTFRAVGIPDILKACRDVHLVKDGAKVDWQELIDAAKVETRRRAEEDKRKEEEQFQGKRRRRLQRMGIPNDLHSEGSSDDDSEDDSDSESKGSVDAYAAHAGDTEPHNDWVTLGLIGHPNVGKSSLINSVMGKKVVSTSRTPGHTKHFQTIHLTSNVRLCDCPGLVFPGIVPKPLQILSGMYRISQVQEPYTAVAYLASRVPLEKVLSLHHADQDDPETREQFKWSAWKMCEAFALQRGFMTARASRPDVYRSANMILRMCADGRILLSSKPEGFGEGKWNKTIPSVTEQEALEESEEEEESDDEDVDDNEGAQGGGAFELLADLEI